MKFRAFDPGELTCLSWSNLPYILVADKLMWKDVGDGVKIQNHQSPPIAFCVIRFRDLSTFEAYDRQLAPGTVLVTEAACSIEYIDAGMVRRSWGGNNAPYHHWNSLILRWDGKKIGWESPPTASTRSSHTGWSTINGHTPKEVVEFITSGRVIQSERYQRLKDPGASTLSQKSDSKRLQETVTHLRTVIAAKDTIITELRKELEDKITENHILRSGQPTSVTSPAQLHSQEPLPDPFSQVSGVPVFDHTHDRQLPSSLVPTVSAHSRL